MKNEEHSALNHRPAISECPNSNLRNSENVELTRNYFPPSATSSAAMAEDCHSLNTDNWSLNDFAFNSAALRTTISYSPETITEAFWRRKGRLSKVRSNRRIAPSPSRTAVEIFSGSIPTSTNKSFGRIVKSTFKVGKNSSFDTFNFEILSNCFKTIENSTEYAWINIACRSNFALPSAPIRSLNELSRSRVRIHNQ
ncbi:hypothetical protein CLV74_1141 [Donghicola tyrosinivorans]|uniref:Uncharacterized protein n=1 Tax=Donghicola tyrosinivorans TaxID=1652492 RepID=A0A2T0WGF4_9RHOB|nr:hypothetical protein CLV74_1141 [Donghicola tyrosinivorans]